MANLQLQYLDAVRNITLTYKGYFQAQVDLQNLKKQNQNKNQIILKPNLSALPNLEAEELMKNVTLRKDGRYMARVQVNKKVHTVYARTHKQIEMKLRNLRKEIKNSELIKTKYTLHQWLDFWWENYKKPFVKYTSDIPMYIQKIKDNFPDNKLENFTTAILQRLMNQFPVSRTKELIMLYLNASFQKAVDTGILKMNPCRAVVKDRKINNKRRAFTFDEQVKIIEAIKGTDIERDIYIYLFTGMRKNEYKPKELLKNIDSVHNTLKIESEKKRSQHPVYRLVDLTPEFIEYIKQPLKFPQLTPQYIYLHFREILKGLKIEGGLHTLRHTFSTNYYYMGIPDKLRSEWLGHEKVDMTQDIYTNIDRSISKEKLLKLYGDFLYKI